MQLSTLQYEVGRWALYNFPNAKPYTPLLGIGEEAGELMHAHLKQEQGIRGTYQKHQHAKLDAVGDLLIYLAHYCELNNLDLDAAIETTWAKVKQRDWQINSEDGGV
jgi:NTP pyrophosphatase (non-canonical NTP hydrolase)